MSEHPRKGIIFTECQETPKRPCPRFGDRAVLKIAKPRRSWFGGRYRAVLMCVCVCVAKSGPEHVLAASVLTMGERIAFAAIAFLLAFTYKNHTNTQ